MGLLAAAILGAGGLAAAGQVGAASMMSGDEPQFHSGGIYFPGSTNPYAAGSSWLTSLLGMYDPSLSAQAGPLDLGLNKFMAVPYEAGAGRSGQERQTARSGAIRDTYSNYQALRDSGLSHDEAYQRAIAENEFGMYTIDELLSYSGYNSGREWFDAEYQYQKHAGTYASLGEQVAQLQRKSLYDAISKSAQIVADTPGFDQATIDEYKARELERLNRELDEAALGVQRQAAMAGTNPGRYMENIQRQRQDADTTALQRALALIQGEQGVALNSINLLQAGSGLGSYLGMVPGYTQAGYPVSVSQPMATQSGAAQQASYLADAAGTLGSGLGNAALVYGSGGSPAWNPTTTITTPQYDFPSLYSSNSFLQGGLL